MAVATQTLPVLDLARPPEEVAATLREALVEVGFFAVVNHGLPWTLVERTFAQAARFHALPEDVKAVIPMTARRMGYVGLGGGTTRSSELDPYGGKKPNLNAAFFMQRDPHPDPERNQFPSEDVLPGFRAAVAEYFSAAEALGNRLLPVYARALDLAPDYFGHFFERSMATLRMSHYPPVPAEVDQWGISAHTDAGFMTMLPTNEVAGLWIRRPDGAWFEPDQPPQSFIVNSGDMLRRWSNDHFRSTPHRVLNQAGVNRYAIPFFFDPNTSTVIECLPSCTSVDDPPKHQPITYRDYLVAFMQRNYAQTTEP